MSSTSVAYRRAVSTIDNSGAGAGQCWLGHLWNLWQWFFTDCPSIDDGRWELVASSPLAASWSNPANIVDNSWFVVKCNQGKASWQSKFQAVNVGVLDEAPGGDWRLVVSFNPVGGWTGKGDPNGGFGGSSVDSSSNLIIGVGNIGGLANGTSLIVGDRDTLLVAATEQGKSDYKVGLYLGRVDPDSDAVRFPSVVLTSWKGGNAGFDRVAMFSNAPGASYVAKNDKTASTLKCWTSGGWLAQLTQPSEFSDQWHYRPFEVTTPQGLVGRLRLVWACGGLATYSRIDVRQKLVLQSIFAGLDNGVCIKHDGSTFWL